jgi:hypothetical protein
MRTKEILKRLKAKLKRKSRIGWEGYIGLVHIEDIEKIINKELEDA